MNTLLIRLYSAFFNCMYNISDMLGILMRYFPYSFGSVLAMNYAIRPRKTMWTILSYGRDSLRNTPGMFTIKMSLPSTASIADISITDYRSTVVVDARIGSIFPSCFLPSAHFLAFTVLYRFSFINTRGSKFLSFS